MTNAEMIATTAHGAIGQTRADGETPYIVHPARVVALLFAWVGERTFPHVTYPIFDAMRDAGWLHDVIEDTKLTYDDLRNFGISEQAIDLIERLTKKPPNALATRDYYEHIAESFPALVVKCADRCANLEDALTDVIRTGQTKRWATYAKKTIVDLMPIYAEQPFLRERLLERLNALQEQLAVESMGQHE